MHFFRSFVILTTITLCFLRQAASGEPSTGIVKIISEPEGAAVYVDGHAQGKAPTFLELAVGKHEVSVFMDGFTPQRKKISVVAGRVSVSHFSFNKKLPKNAIRVQQLDEGGADSGIGTVTVVTDPPGLEVIIDNRKVPKTTPVAFDIHSGVYKLRIKQDGNVVVEKTIVVQAGRYLDFDFSFRKRRTIDEMDPWK